MAAIAVKSGQFAATQLMRFQHAWPHLSGVTAARQMSLCLQTHCLHIAGSVMTTWSAHFWTTGSTTDPIVILIVSGSLIAPPLSTTHNVKDQIPSPSET